MVVVVVVRRRGLEAVVGCQTEGYFRAVGKDVDGRSRHSTLARSWPFDGVTTVFDHLPELTVDGLFVSVAASSPCLSNVERDDGEAWLRGVLIVDFGFWVAVAVRYVLGLSMLLIDRWRLPRESDVPWTRRCRVADADADADAEGAMHRCGNSRNPGWQVQQNPDPSWALTACDRMPGASMQQPAILL